jgi:hypothetical protein
MRLSPWGRVVAISALLVVGGAVALAIGALASTREYRRSYPVLGAVESLRFDLADGDIVVVGGGQRDSVQVDRTERYAFGHGPQTTRRAAGAAFAVRSRCPTSLLGPCAVAYRVVVPDNVGLDIHTTTGSVSLRGYRGSARVVTGAGGIDISGYCGNALDARAGAGAINFQAACAPPRMSLRTGSGPITAIMPTGRYDLDAESSSGHASVRGVTARSDAPYAVQVLSGSGDVSVEGRS